MRIAVLADTHVRADRRPNRLPDAVVATVATCDVVLHAGDVIDPFVLDDLASLAPTHAVLGNNDNGLAGTLPERLELDLDGVAVAVVHDSGATKGRATRVHRWFPSADVVVFGHSHMPVDEEGVDGQRLFNPGSPTQRRRAPFRSMGVLETRNGRLVGREIVRID